MRRYSPAFNLIEVLTVITIISLLTGVSLVTYGKIRRSSRDSQRLLHITQIQSALAAYHRDLGHYPATLVPGSALEAGNQSYLKLIPTNPTPVESPCEAAPEYSYTPVGSAPNYRSYQLTFCLSSATAELPIGQHTATPEGIIN
jgi:prepilin-type N-terminal cleavage/methylation domain-containing protein